VANRASFVVDTAIRKGQAQNRQFAATRAKALGPDLNRIVGTSLVRAAFDHHGRVVPQMAFGAHRG
jgi:hypothetical protein